MAKKSVKNAAKTSRRRIPSTPKAWHSGLRRAFLTNDERRQQAESKRRVKAASKAAKRDPKSMQKHRNKLAERGQKAFPAALNAANRYWRRKAHKCPNSRVISSKIREKSKGNKKIAAIHPLFWPLFRKQRCRAIPSGSLPAKTFVSAIILTFIPRRNVSGPRAAWIVVKSDQDGRVAFYDSQQVFVDWQHLQQGVKRQSIEDVAEKIKLLKREERKRQEAKVVLSRSGGSQPRPGYGWNWPIAAWNYPPSSTVLMLALRAFP